MLALPSAPTAGLGTGPGTEGPRLNPGAIEIGLAGALVSVEGGTRATIGVRGGRFLAAGSGLAGLEAELGYSHQQALDGVDLEGSLSWQRAARARAIHPFAAIGGGLRAEKLGSFSQARYPVGFALGMRALIDHHVALRIEYRYRRVLNDPVANFSEHQALTGISLLLHNSERPERGEEKRP